MIKENIYNHYLMNMLMIYLIN